MLMWHFIDLFGIYFEFLLFNPQLDTGQQPHKWHLLTFFSHWPTQPSSHANGWVLTLWNCAYVTMSRYFYISVHWLLSTLVSRIYNETQNTIYDWLTDWLTLLRPTRTQPKTQLKILKLSITVAHPHALCWFAPAAKQMTIFLVLYFTIQWQKCIYIYIYI